MDGSRRSPRKKYKVTDRFEYTNMIDRLRPHIYDMSRGKISQCTQWLVGASNTELQGMRDFGTSFVANALSGRHWRTKASWVPKEQQLVEYMNVAIAKKLCINDWSQERSAIEMAAGMGLLNVLTLLLDGGYSLEGQYNAVYAAVSVSNHAALNLILSKSAAKARDAIKDEAESSWSSLGKAVENCDYESVEMLLQYRCATMGDQHARIILRSGVKRKNLKIILHQIYPKIPNVLHWSAELHWSFPTTARETLNWLWHALHRPSSSCMVLEDEIWLEIFSFFGRDAFVKDEDYSSIPTANEVESFYRT